MKISEISRGISHIEDIPPREIVEIVHNLPDYQITEKVDGAQILFGIDENGFYTSRESKGGVRIYNEADYDVQFSSTYMRSSHLLLENLLPALREAGLRPGDQVEAEVLYGELPNVVPYSNDTSYIILLRTTEGTVSIDSLQKKLNEKIVTVSLTAPYTDDGINIHLKEETNSWKFSRVPLIEKISVPPSLRTRADSINDFMLLKDRATGQTYGTVLETPLNKIPPWVEPGTWKDVKAVLKERKVHISTVLLELHILPIKEILLDCLVRNRASAYGPTVESGGWIEGIVLKHKQTNRMVKIVDKTVFGTIRESAWKKRNELTERAKSTDECNSVLGKLYLTMATSLGHPLLGTIHAKRYLNSVGSLTEDILLPLTETSAFESIREYWTELFEFTSEQLTNDLDKYKITEKSNTNPAIYKRTLQSYATIFEKISHFNEVARDAKSAKDLFSMLVGK